ncbi:hypothetical protein, unlikely [Trypanosoma brucei gambiense DAL972]|uniref:Uncharacterized protein n=1 Tax=Trypanosoma brucei gambiense (strain MHOM/CI/86/DAL972) TaxID=679716 RepID=D0AAT7_TRYB9|nr:hypothetical protein, unlikely [Trypanosoma brucei gambiense DAL972]CBH18788.1 hypothetical protein, unlikely [Trypanosoma brucei gambiense DAL972]|eukprot:XP_011781052.1 hypothetical protein, unlikely [Trypanosoma brucei gambiense DAL972]
MYVFTTMRIANRLLSFPNSARALCVIFLFICFFRGGKPQLRYLFCPLAGSFGVIVLLLFFHSCLPRHMYTQIYASLFKLYRIAFKTDDDDDDGGNAIFRRTVEEMEEGNNGRSNVNATRQLQCGDCFNNHE